MTQYCLVTGGAGYIGSHFCKALSKTEFTPVVIDNLFRGHQEFVQWGPFIQGDIRENAIINEAFEQYSPVAVFHFSGLTYVGESVEHPDMYYENNLAGSISLLSAMKMHGCKNIIFSSTAATYGMPQTPLIDEKHPQNPINPYGWSKYFVERLLKDYASAYGIKFAALRYFNACGADEECEIGEWHTPETHLIPLILQAAEGTRPHIKIFGTDYPTQDGTAVRDYIHVTDLAHAHILALRHTLNGGNNVCLNLGTGNGYSVKEVISEVKHVTRTDFPVIPAPRRAGDPATLVASSEAAQKTLKWQARHSSLSHIIKTAWEWQQSLKKRLKI